MALSLLYSIVVLLSISLAYGCAPTPAPTPPNPPPNPAPPSTGRTTNVLWLGNSYTYLHDVPKMVQELGRYEGKSISYDQHTNGGWTLQKHANSPTSSNKIRGRKWDVVIMQEQSQLPVFGESQVCSQTVASLKSLVGNVRASNPSARVQLYGTWGRPGENEFEQWQYWLTRRYKTFACMISKPSRMAPVGEGFKKFGEKYGSQARIGLYENNDHHASKKGAYLAACMHYLAIYGPGTTIVGNSYDGGLGQGTAKQIQEVAQEVWNDGNGWDYPTDGSCNLSMC